MEWWMVGLLMVVGLLLLTVLGVASMGSQLKGIAQELRSIHETLLQLLKK